MLFYNRYSYIFSLVSTAFIFVFIILLLGSWVSSFCIDPFLLAALIPIKIYPNAEADKATILQENKNKSGIYM